VSWAERGYSRQHSSRRWSLVPRWKTWSVGAPVWHVLNRLSKPASHHFRFGRKIHQRPEFHTHVDPRRRLWSQDNLSLWLYDSMSWLHWTPCLGPMCLSRLRRIPESRTLVVWTVTRWSAMGIQGPNCLWNTGWKKALDRCLQYKVSGGLAFLTCTKIPKRGQ